MVVKGIAQCVDESVLENQTNLIEPPHQLII